MADEVVDELGADLYLADPRLGLGVGNVKASAGRVMKAQVADAHVTQLADRQAAVTERGDHRAPADVIAGRRELQATHVVAHRRLGQAELLRDRARAQAASEPLGYSPAG